MNNILWFFFLFLISSGVIEANSVDDLHNALIPVSAATINCNGNNSSSVQCNVNNTNTNTNSSSSQALSNGGSSSSGRSTPNANETAPGKLFVGGLSWQTSSEKLREYFGMFGTVTDVLIMKDPITQVCSWQFIYYQTKKFIFIISPHFLLLPLGCEHKWRQDWWNFIDFIDTHFFAKTSVNLSDVIYVRSLKLFVTFIHSLIHSWKNKIIFLPVQTNQPRLKWRNFSFNWISS